MYYIIIIIVFYFLFVFVTAVLIKHPDNVSSSPLTAAPPPPIPGTTSVIVARDPVRVRSPRNRRTPHGNLALGGGLQMTEIQNVFVRPHSIRCSTVQTSRARGHGDVQHTHTHARRVRF